MSKVIFEFDEREDNQDINIIVYPESGICSVDSIAELEVVDNSKFKEI